MVPYLPLAIPSGSASPSQTQTILDQLFAQGMVGANAFAFNITWNTTTGFGGSAFIGNYSDVPNFPTITTWMNVSINPNALWSFQLNNVAFNGTSLGYSGRISWDTVSPYSVVPMSVLNVFVQITGLQSPSYTQEGLLTLVTYDCATPTAGLKNFTYTIAGQQVTFTSNQYTIQVGSVCQFAFAGSDAVVSSPVGWSIGSIMMNHAYTVFDYDRQALGYLLRD